MINHKKKFIFIHIPKTAGHSIDTMFLDLGLVDEELWHFTSLEIIKKFDRKMWDEYFSFSIVRNPWSRFLSEYIWQGGNFKTAIETNGTIPINFQIDWVSVSPKEGSELIVKSGNELKVVYEAMGIEIEQMQDPPLTPLGIT